MAGVPGSHCDSFPSFPLQTLGPDEVLSLTQEGRGQRKGHYTHFRFIPQSQEQTGAAWHWSQYKPGSATSWATLGNPSPSSELSAEGTEMGDIASVGTVV